MRILEGCDGGVAVVIVEGAAGVAGVVADPASRNVTPAGLFLEAQ